MGKLVKHKLSEGHQIVLSADVDDPVKESLIHNWAQKIGLQEVVSKSTAIDVPTHQ